LLKRFSLFCILFLLGSVCFPVDIGQDIIARGAELVGTPYRYGGTNPGGFDCSGLVNYLYKPFLPGLPRTASSMSRYGTAISPDQLKAGDLVFYATGHDRSSVTHVGIYIGQNTLIQAVSAGPVRGVVLTDIDEKYWKERYAGARRVFPRSEERELRSVNLSYSKGHYSGTVENLEPDGRGRMVLNNGDVYMGDFLDGLFHGSGEYHYGNGDVYKGHFIRGRESGGELIRSDGSRYSAVRNEAGQLIINRRVDRSSNRINYLLQAPTQWDQWLEHEQNLFEESLQSDNSAVEEEQRRFEEWKKSSGL